MGYFLTAKAADGDVTVTARLQCDNGGFCPPDDYHLDYDECCVYFKDSCCTHSENEKLKTM